MLRVYLFLLGLCNGLLNGKISINIGSENSDMRSDKYAEITYYEH